MAFPSVSLAQLSWWSCFSWWNPEQPRGCARAREAPFSDPYMAQDRSTTGGVGLQLLFLSAQPQRAQT